MNGTNKKEIERHYFAKETWKEKGHAHGFQMTQFQELTGR